MATRVMPEQHPAWSDSPAYERQDISCVKAWRIRRVMLQEEHRLTLVARDYATDQYAPSITAWHLVAERAGVDRVTLLNIKNGRTDDVMLSTAERIVEACGKDWPVEIDQDLHVIPRRGRRCARLMAEQSRAFYPEWTLDQLTDYYLALRASEERHDPAHGDAA